MRKQPRKDDVLKAASELFGEKGYAATSVIEIARRAKLSKSGLYHHIRGKRALLFEICNSSMQELLERARLAKAETDDPVGQINGIIKAHSDYYWKTASNMASLAQARFLSAAERKRITSMERDYLDLVRDAIKEGQRLGVFSSANPTVVAFSMFALLNSPVQWYRPKGRLGREEVIEEMRQLYLNGILTR